MLNRNVTEMAKIIVVRQKTLALMKHIYGALMRPLLRDYHVYMYVSRFASHVEASSLTVEKGDKEGNNLRRIMKHATGFFYLVACERLLSLSAANLPVNVEASLNDAVS